MANNKQQRRGNEKKNNISNKKIKMTNLFKWCLLGHMPSVEMGAPHTQHQ